MLLVPGDRNLFQFGSCCIFFCRLIEDFKKLIQIHNTALYWKGDKTYFKIEKYKKNSFCKKTQNFCVCIDGHLVC